MESIPDLEYRIKMVKVYFISCYEVFMFSGGRSIGYSCQLKIHIPILTSSSQVINHNHGLLNLNKITICIILVNMWLSYNHNLY